MSVMGFPAALGGVIGSVINSAVGTVTHTVAGASLHAIDSWVLDGTRAALDSVAHIIGVTTAPNLESSWFSATYWRVAGLATVLTLPFLFAAAVHALLRSDPMLVARAALVQLPLALVGVSMAAPVVMLLLAATDQMCAVVAGPGAGGGARFLTNAGQQIVGASALAGSPFFAMAIGLMTIGAAVGLMVELLIREAAVYVVVLMLPLAFAALVWPARRVFSVRLLELLTALILSKFVIVAVLSLAGSALGHASGVPRLLTAMTLVLLSCLAPWALLRLIPFTELGASASETLRHHGRNASRQMIDAAGAGIAVVDGAAGLAGALRRQAQSDGQLDPNVDAHPSTHPADGAGPAQPPLAGSAGNPVGDHDPVEPISTKLDQPTLATAGSQPPPGDDTATPAATEPEFEREWWEADDMSVPDLRLGTGGINAPDWVPPVPEPRDPEPSGPTDPESPEDTA